MRIQNISYKGSVLKATAIAMAAFYLSGCQGDERLAEVAKIEGEESAKKQTEVENRNLADKAKLMEEDLNKRHRFYQALKGTYEGILKTQQGTFNIRVVMIPSLAPYKVERVRTLEEISSDLNQLAFTIQMVQWNPSNNLSAVGCSVSGVKPSLKSGEIPIASSECANLYQIFLSDGSRDMRLDQSIGIAQDILDGKLEDIKEIKGQVYPSTVGSVYTFIAKKVQN